MYMFSATCISLNSIEFTHIEVVVWLTVYTRNKNHILYKEQFAKMRYLEKKRLDSVELEIM